MTAEISDNIIYGTKTPVLIEDPAAAVVTGVNNWIQTNASAGPLTGSIQTASPGFRNPAAKDYTLSSGSACIGAASASVYGLPGKEYFVNEATNRLWRIRATARDLGAFEGTSSNSPVGPYDPVPRPALGISRSGPQVVISWPLFAQDFRLQTSALVDPKIWNAATFGYTTNLTGLSAALSASNSPAFLRLQE
jgi:hypothetical protein